MIDLFVLTKLLYSAMVWKAFIFQAFTCKLILTHSSPSFCCVFFFIFEGGEGEAVKDDEVVFTIYYRSRDANSLLFLGRVVCKCGSCGTEKQALSEWERHTGSKSRNWKTSVRVKGSMLSLEQWVSAPLPFTHAYCLWPLLCLSGHVAF